MAMVFQLKTRIREPQKSMNCKPSSDHPLRTYQRPLRLIHPIWSYYTSIRKPKISRLKTILVSLFTHMSNWSTLSGIISGQFLVGEVTKNATSSRVLPESLYFFPYRDWTVRLILPTPYSLEIRRPTTLLSMKCSPSQTEMPRLDLLCCRTLDSHINAL